jgi:hypothetical protein
VKALSIIISITSTSWVLFAAGSAPRESDFSHPPADARPWVYWFWNNGNVTSNGITADLEAMQRVGIGGVLIMDVDVDFAPPRGTAEFMNEEWRNLFQFSAMEAARLGLEINMANGPGWCGSSGPWITPELSMQKLVWTNIIVNGPTNFSAFLPRPDTTAPKRGSLDSQVELKDYYEDASLLAFPVTTNGIVPRNAVINLSRKLKADGKLDWHVPPGSWTIERIGHASTGSSTRPKVAGGNGLECDKLSRRAMNVQFANMMGRLVTNGGPLVGKSLVATHIDSWEVGSQNWTPMLRREFKKRRGYDLLPWLPCVTEHQLNVSSAAAANRFRWDFSQTLAELLAENYSGGLAGIAHKHGLRYSLEGYDLPFGDEYTYTARADEPMTEFWTDNNNVTYHKAVEMASVGHVYGRPIIGAEAFTSGGGEMWKMTPADIKALGDYEFSQGVNRFVIHRYAHQPYMDRWPGVTMGPWGLHYERTETWWEMSRPWHEYLARCQYLLRQGKFVADLCYLRPEKPNQTYFKPNPPVPVGYRYDEISAEALIERMFVRGGRLLLPDGMNYRALVLPPEKAMTPGLMRKIRELVQEGATVVATAGYPTASPSLQDFPACDKTVARLGRRVWGDCDGANVTEHTLSRGRLIWGKPLESVLATLNATPDFLANAKLNWIHRRAGGTEIYFVANPAAVAVETRCTFRVNGLCPELWNPETGDISPLAVYDMTPAGTSVPLRLEESGSAFIVFRRGAQNFDAITSLRHNGQPVPEPSPAAAKVVIEQATYGILNDTNRSRDVRAQVQAMVDDGKTTFMVADLVKAGDPAYGVVKTFSAVYTLDGETMHASGKDPDMVTLRQPTAAPERPVEVTADANGKVSLLVREPGSYEWTTSSGQTAGIEIPSVPPAIEIAGPWHLTFPPKWGAPDPTTLTNLISWSDSADPGIKYFSGTATYTTTFIYPGTVSDTAGQKLLLDIGDIRVMAHVKLNGQDCGIVWKRPYRVDVTHVIKSGENQLEISVANLWPNRMIGDAALPETNRLTWSSWEPFTTESKLLKSGLLGPVKIATFSACDAKGRPSHQ